MLSRSSLWQRLAGAPLWPLAWALAGACALPWLVPERWSGEVPTRWVWLGSLGWVMTLPLLRDRRWRVLPITLGLMGLTFLGLAREARRETALPTGFLALEGRLAAPWTRQGDRLRSRLQVRTPAALAGFELPLSVPAEGTPPPSPGTPVRLRADLWPVAPAPTFLPERPLWRARSDAAPRRIHLSSAQLMEILGSPSPSWPLRLQTFIRTRFEALPLDATARDLWGALALGIPPADEAHFSVFAESGTLHILVVSGLQVTLVMGVVATLLRRLRMRGATLGCLLAGVTYALLVGFSAPVWRGLFMGAAWALGRSSGWKLPPVAGLHVALFLWLLPHPAAGAEPGFLLGWWALLGLLWATEPLAGLLSPLLGRLATPLAAVAAPWLSTLPLLAILHGGIPTWGILANLLVLPLVTFLTPLCLLLILLPLPGATASAAALLSWLGHRLVPAFTGLTPVATGVLWPWLLLAAGWLVLAHRQGTLRRTRALSLALVAGSFALLAIRGTGTSAATFCLEAPDIGQGDALLVRVPGGAATLIDSGPTPWAARRLARVLSRRGVREPVHLVLTHPHGDHAGGWATLTRLWPFASVSLPVTTGASDPWTPFLPLRSPSLSGLLRGDEWVRGQAAFSVRWPPAPLALEEANPLSLVLRIRWRDREVWLMADALARQELDLLDLGDPGLASHRLLKAGHHGSRNASTPAWIQSLDPEVALLTAGRNNHFGHPHGETLEALRQQGTSIWVTGMQGGVRFLAVPGAWEAETGDGGRALIPCRNTRLP